MANMVVLIPLVQGQLQWAPGHCGGQVGGHFSTELQCQLALCAGFVSWHGHLYCPCLKAVPATWLQQLLALGASPARRKLSGAEIASTSRACLLRMHGQMQRRPPLSVTGPQMHGHYYRIGPTYITRRSASGHHMDCRPITSTCLNCRSVQWFSVACVFSNGTGVG